MPKIRYIGAKEVKFDNVAGTGLSWYGYGDVQTVPQLSQAQHLARFTDIWELIPDDPDAPPLKPVGTNPEEIGGASLQAQQAPAAPTLANMSLGNPEDHEDDDPVATAPGAMVAMPGTSVIPPTATKSGTARANKATDKATKAS